MSTKSTTFTQQYVDAMKKYAGKGALGASATAQQAVAPKKAEPSYSSIIMDDVEFPEIKSADSKPKQGRTPMFMEQEDNSPSSWVRFSEVFGFAPPSGNDRRGPVYDSGMFDPAVAAFVPKKTPGYFMPPASTEALWHAHIDNDIVWLHGLSGTGKSSLEQEFAAHIGQPFLRFNGREDIESSALFGQLIVEEGEHGGTVWKDGLLTEAVKYGARALMDEATLIPAGIWMGVQWLLEKEGKLMLTDKPASAGDRLVTPDSRFRLTFADNTKGQGDHTGMFTGTGVMNSATLNRVGLTLEIDYLTEQQELTVLQAKHGTRVHVDVLTGIIRLAGLLRNGMRAGEISLAFSLRTIDSVLHKAYNYRTSTPDTALRRAFAEGYSNLLPTEDEQGAAFEMFRIAMGDIK